MWNIFRKALKNKRLIYKHMSLLIMDYFSSLTCEIVVKTGITVFKPNL